MGNPKLAEVKKRREEKQDAAQPKGLTLFENMAMSTIPPVFPVRVHMLILEEIADAWNLGKILRCAEAFGVKEVLFILQNAVARSAIQSSVESMSGLSLSFVESAAE